MIAAEPALDAPLADDAIDAALEAVADFSDLKSPWFSGHSRGVARLAANAARRAGLGDHAVTELRRAGLVHDLGRAGVPNTIWDKPGALNDSERERVRLHPYYTERVLARPEALAGLGAIAVCHHERLDASGYHRSLPGSALSPAARIVAAADVYHALTEERPHRLARKPEVAAAELRKEVRTGRSTTPTRPRTSSPHRPRAGQRPRARPPGWAHGARAGGAGARRPRRVQPRCRAPASDRRQDRAQPRRAHLLQARGLPRAPRRHCTRCATGSSTEVEANAPCRPADRSVTSSARHAPNALPPSSSSRSPAGAMSSPTSHGVAYM